MGARDRQGDADEFLARHGLTFPVVWDPTGRSWVDFGVPTQPAAVLIMPDGTWVKRWAGMFDEDEVLRLAAG